MKNKNLLFLLPIMALVSCDVTNSGGGNSNSINAKIFEEKVATLKGQNVKLDGTLSYKFYDSETGQPTSTDPVVSSFVVEFTDNGYLIDYDGKFDSKLSQHLFKSSDNTVELRYINELNEFTTYRPVDDEKNEYDFTPYTNPFGLLTSDNLSTSDDEKGATFDLDSSLPVAIDFVSRLTFYTFDNIEELSFTANDEMLQTIHIATPVLTETLRSGTFTFDLTVSGTGDEVLGPVEPKPAEPNEKQAVLETALKELQDNDYEATLTADLGYMTYNLSLFKNKSGLFCRDNDEPKYSLGYLYDEDQLYNVYYDRNSKTYMKEKSTYTKEEYEDNFKPNWLMFSPVLFEPTENSGEFKSSSLINERLAGTFGVLLTGSGCYDLAACSTFKVNLDENNHIKTITLIGSEENFGVETDFVITITKIGSCEMPFNLSELAE